MEFGPPENVVHRAQGFVSARARRLLEELAKFSLRQGMVAAHDFIAEVDQEERQSGFPGEGPEVPG